MPRVDALTGEPEKSKMTDRKHKERNRYFPDGKIVLYGISMGAATVMQASGLPLPESVVGIVEDCGFTSAYEEFRHMLKSMAHLPGFPLLNILGWQCKCFFEAGYQSERFPEMRRRNKAADAVSARRCGRLRPGGNGKGMLRRLCR